MKRLHELEFRRRYKTDEAALQAIMDAIRLRVLCASEIVCGIKEHSPPIPRGGIFKIRVSKIAYHPDTQYFEAHLVAYKIFATPKQRSDAAYTGANQTSELILLYRLASHEP